MGKYFGTDGFRGKAGTVLTADHAFKTGRFLGWYYSKKHLDDKARIVLPTCMKMRWRPELRLPEQTYTCCMLQQPPASAISPVLKDLTAV